MNPVLGAVLLAGATGAVSAFVAFWMGRAKPEREARILRRRYELMSALNVDLAVALADLKGRLGHLTPDEAAAFQHITTYYGKDAA